MKFGKTIIKKYWIPYRASLVRNDKSGLAAEERATIIIEVVFQDNLSGKVIWSSKEITDYADYALNEDINLLPAAKKQSLIKLSNDIVEKAFNLMMSGF